MGLADQSAFEPSPDALLPALTPAAELAVLARARPN